MSCASNLPSLDRWRRRTASRRRGFAHRRGADRRSMAQAAETGQSSGAVFAESATPDGAPDRNPHRSGCGILGAHAITHRARPGQCPGRDRVVQPVRRRRAAGLRARQVRGGRYASHLWSVPWSGGRAQRLTSGAVRDVNPAISPDGRTVAFARTAVGPEPGEAQIWILPLDGGEAWQLTKQRHGAGSPTWSPDGRRLLFLGAAGEDRFIVGRVRPKQAPVARRITRTDFRDDDSGLLGAPYAPVDGRRTTRGPTAPPDPRRLRRRGAGLGAGRILDRVHRRHGR